MRCPETKAAICGLLQITEDHYEMLFFESAMQYLYIMLPSDWRGREILHQAETFWVWWKREYKRRDMKVLAYWQKDVPKLRAEGEYVSDDIGMKRREYEMKEYELKEIYPPPMRVRQAVK